MSAAVQTAAINEALELSHMFRENAALRHGLPRCPAAQRIDQLDEETPKKPEPPVVNITNNIPAAPAAPHSSLGAAAAVTTGSLARAAAPYLLTALGAGGLAAGASYYLNDTPTPAVEPVEQPPTGDLFEYLQQRGDHLPGGWPSE